MKGILWTNDDDLFLSKKINEMTNEQLAKALGRTVGAVQQRMNLLFLKREPIEYAYYKDDELLAVGTADELAERFKVTRDTIMWYSHTKTRDLRIKVIRLSVEG